MSDTIWVAVIALVGVGLSAGVAAIVARSTTQAQLDGAAAADRRALRDAKAVALESAYRDLVVAADLIEPLLQALFSRRGDHAPPQQAFVALRDAVNRVRPAIVVANGPADPALVLLDRDVFPLVSDIYFASMPPHNASIEQTMLSEVRAGVTAIRQRVAETLEQLRRPV